MSDLETQAAEQGKSTELQSIKRDLIIKKIII